MKALIKQLHDLSEWETHPFKKRSYLKTAEIIKGIAEVEFNTRKDFKDIEGIGDAINKKILQFKETGYIKKWKEIQEAEYKILHLSCTIEKHSCSNTKCNIQKK